jgi:methylmalonyl-CoA/ethylmalonyl-CoA epimerase
MNATKSTRLARISQIAVNAQDLERAVAFYRDALRLPLQFQVEGMAFFDCAGQRLMVGLPSAPEYDHPSSILYFEVDDIDATWTELLARGVEGRRAPFLVHQAEDHELWLAFFRDTEGNTLALSCAKR